MPPTTEMISTCSWRPSAT